MDRKTMEQFFGEEWVDFMSPFVQSQEFTAILTELRKQKNAGEKIIPLSSEMFKAFNVLPLSKVRVVILGQDPYPGEGMANGLAFAHDSKHGIAVSLQIMLNAIEKDAYSGLWLEKSMFNTELTQWTDQGVMLLNSALTTKLGVSGAHAVIWQPFITYFVKTMVTIKRDVIWLALGAQACSFMKDVPVFDRYSRQASHPMKSQHDKTEWKTDIFSFTNAVITANRLGEKIKW